MWKSCLQVRENDTKKVTVKVKRIVNVDVVYFVHHVKVFGECITFHALLFQDKLYNSDVLRCDLKNNEYIVQAVSVYGRHMQTVRGTVSSTE